MPTYQYACTACGHQLEVVQSFSDAALTECPDCQGRLRKLYSGVGIVFKGSGFYRTDSRSDSSSSSSSDSATPAKSETKSESTTSTSTPATPSTSSTPAPAASSSSSSSSSA